MGTVSVNCPDPDCGKEDIDVEVTAGHDDHPYGSTTARESYVEVDGAECPDCHRDLTDEAVEAAADQ